MSYSLYHAQALKADSNYLTGTCLSLNDQGNTSLVKGIIHPQPDDDTTWYYRDLFETLDQLEIPFTIGRRPV